MTEALPELSGAYNAVPRYESMEARFTRHVAGRNESVVANPKLSKSIGDSTALGAEPKSTPNGIVSFNTNEALNVISNPQASLDNAPSRLSSSSPLPPSSSSQPLKTLSKQPLPLPLPSLPPLSPLPLSHRAHSRSVQLRVDCSLDQARCNLPNTYPHGQRVTALDFMQLYGHVLLESDGLVEFFEAIGAKLDITHLSSVSSHELPRNREFLKRLLANVRNLCVGCALSSDRIRSLFK